EFDLEHDLEGYFKVKLIFLNGNPYFFHGFGKSTKFYVRICYGRFFRQGHFKVKLKTPVTAKYLRGCAFLWKLFQTKV
ncbi:hypothetical protein DD595_26210, partial [Enterobacter cloacae complex sp. 4DZ3-17B2]